MLLFLVRHGETVDNVAGIYAGTRDSPLTSHGVLQARRLGAHLASRGVRHIFSSDLRRAVETAQAIVDAVIQVQTTRRSAVTAAPSPVTALVQLPDLRERDFGGAEGKKFGTVSSLADGDVAAETRPQMRMRAERFVTGWLEPLFLNLDRNPGGQQEGSCCVVVVAHGMILGELLAALLARFAPGEVHKLGGRPVLWSNTGYAELVVRVDDQPMAPTTAVPGLGNGPGEVESEGMAAADVASGDKKERQPRVSLSLVAVNVLKHLEGLKKTRGGIGSARFDKRQRTMDSFFASAAKKQRVDLEGGVGDT
ncbi:phosphoglycerate mutase-like protein [Canariomyces notabilis]|uniref:Phosphoglycerate mutase-like protein n=1 Tax=Canariomyces notabilis TaxID=2074819 RepID=A0AAN6TB49_9PEZI|nr:phosphoglycerate mutase-like protein [Canariomyces arenarius]